jgi:hypothetical protein
MDKSTTAPALLLLSFRRQIWPSWSAGLCSASPTPPPSEVWRSFLSFQYDAVMEKGAESAGGSYTYDTKTHPLDFDFDFEFESYLATIYDERVATLSEEPYARDRSMPARLRARASRTPGTRTIARNGFTRGSARP